ncbi:uncharacterized protein LOC132200598 isoform X3 [Neocloeon triangulifer]|uniref:uncharacterized protein LOC132200598 isoform X3 n=1 Tax=Neocloeon triangulifer TaxID=2078957 RepID=UPI00286F3B84|nr:uncharacterized protein LOC132200598 isoform X3 [Neocloeon triangulifer]
MASTSNADTEDVFYDSLDFLIVPVALKLFQLIDDAAFERIIVFLKSFGSDALASVLTCELNANFKSSPIRFACAERGTDVLEPLLRGLTLADKRKVISMSGYDGLSAFHVAIEQQNNSVCKYLITNQLAEPSSKVMKRDERNAFMDTNALIGDTAFHIASRNSDTDTLHLLMEYYSGSADRLRKCLTMTNEDECDALWILLGHNIVIPDNQHLTTRKLSKLPLIKAITDLRSENSSIISRLERMLNTGPTQVIQRRDGSYFKKCAMLMEFNADFQTTLFQDIVAHL